MADVGLSDVLSLVQTIAIISALLMTLYFSRRQLAGFAVDLETRVLNDLDEKFHRIGEIFIARPELTRMVYQSKERLDPETPLAYYILFFCAHIYHMRQRGILQENEWQGWLQWMRNAFQLGTIATNWKEGGMGSWFDPAFQQFVERELISVVEGANSARPGTGSPPSSA